MKKLPYLPVWHRPINVRRMIEKNLRLCWRVPRLPSWPLFLINLLAVVFGLAGPNAGLADAYNIWRGWPTEVEFMLAPDYCKAKFDSDYFSRKQATYLSVPKSEKEKWESRLGGVYHHMHHYCFGTVLLSRALNPNWARRNGVSPSTLFRRAAGEIAYTVNADTVNNPLWLKMRLDLARAYEGAGDLDSARALYKQMIARFPGDESIYVAQAKMAKRSGDDALALEILSQGEQRVTRKRAIYFELAQLQFSLGDYRRAESYTTKAEKAGLDMSKMRERLGMLGTTGMRNAVTTEGLELPAISEPGGSN